MTPRRMEWKRLEKPLRNTRPPPEIGADSTGGQAQKPAAMNTCRAGFIRPVNPMAGYIPPYRSNPGSFFRTATFFRTTYFGSPSAYGG